MGNTKLYVGNLNYQTSEETLKTAFAAFGNVVSATVITGKGFGFVEMGSAEEAQKAKESLNSTELDGRTIKVDEARPKREGGYKPRTGGGFGNRGGYRGNRDRY
jgi:RNA recognition motif-containing protein